MTYVKKELRPKKIFADEDGRCIAVEINYQNKKILIINIYAPNGAKKEFFEELNKKISSHNFEHIILAGDFNGTVSNELDRSPMQSKSKAKTKMGELPKAFYEIVENSGLLDLWRKQ